MRSDLNIQHRIGVIHKKVGGLHKAEGPKLKAPAYAEAPAGKQSSKQDKSSGHWVIELRTSKQGSHF